ncbi:RICIN domain-containing protein [Streptomyces sp. SBT349]|uniref:RICIN domain-containing protein n=1 Tax=Streptomyces sp. SBT349 TaxID=1580539 RepID=UPI00066CF949|nr:RICIN domain-containing protein [Streptomyces sp. SBT349]
MVRNVAAVVSAMLVGLLMSLSGTGPAGASADDWSGAFRIVHVSTSQRLVPNDGGGDTSENAVVWAALTPPGPDGQDWQLQRVDAGVGAGVGAGAHRIRNLTSRLCLKAGITGYGPTVLQGTCSTADDTQRWRLEETGAGYRISSVATGDAIASYASRGDYWAMLGPEAPTLAQRWRLVGL